MRGALVVALSLTTGCHTTGGKLFGAASVASGVASVYLLANSGATIEDHRLVSHNDDQAAGVALMFAAAIAAGGWAISELVFGPGSVGGGGGWPPPVLEPPPPLVVEPPSPPVAEPAPPPEPAPAPAAEPPPAPPTVIIVRDHDRDGQGRPRGGWRLDPQDGLDRLYGPDGQLRGWINAEGYVWYRTGGADIGRVDITPRCGPACRHAQARHLLDGMR